MCKWLFTLVNAESGMCFLAVHVYTGALVSWQQDFCYARSEEEQLTFLSVFNQSASIVINTFRFQSVQVPLT